MGRQSLNTESLEGFLTDRLTNWRTNRQGLDKKWEMNFEMFSRITNEIWKKGEAGKETDTDESWRSQTYYAKAKQKAVSGYSIIIDMLLQGGRLPFMLKPSPWSENYIEDMADDQAEEIADDIGNMERLILQQLTDTRADRTIMQEVSSCARYGEAYLKKTVEEITRKGFKKQGPQGVEDQGRMDSDNFEWFYWEDTFMSPGVDFVPVWNIVRDLEAQDPNKGTGIFHQELVGAHYMRGRKGRPFYLDDSIDDVLEMEDNNKTSEGQAAVDVSWLPPRLRHITHRQSTIEIAEYWGRAPRLQVERFEEELKLREKNKGNEDFAVPFITRNQTGEEEQAGDEVEIMCVLVRVEKEEQGTIIRYSRLDEGLRPFQRVVWEEDLDENGGIGVMDNCANTQIAVNGLVRAIEDNAKLSGNVVVGMKRRYIENPEDIDNGLQPGTVLEISDDCPDARMALQSIEINNVTPELMAMLAKWEDLMDKDAQISPIIQGQVEPGQQTLGEINRLMTQAGKYIGGILRNQDEMVIEPLIEYFYEYNMLDPSVDAGKGDYIIQATGFTSFQARAERLTKLQQLLSMALSSPELAKEMKIDWIIDEMSKAMDIDPDQSMKSKEDKATEAQEQAAAAASDPVIQLQFQKEQAIIAKTAADAAENEAHANERMASIELDRETLQLKTALDRETLQLKTALEREKLQLEKAQLIADIESKQVQAAGRAIDDKTQRGPDPQAPDGVRTGYSGLVGAR